MDTYDLRNRLFRPKLPRKVVLQIAIIIYLLKTFIIYEMIKLSHNKLLNILNPHLDK